jgi:hypothetical protein
MRLHASGRRKNLKDSKVKVYQDEPHYGLVGNRCFTSPIDCLGGRWKAGPAAFDHWINRAPESGRGLGGWGHIAGKPVGRADYDIPAMGRIREAVAFVGVDNQLHRHSQVAKRVPELE